MKAIGIVCSPRRNGNSEVLVREVLNAAGDGAAKVLRPNEMKIRGCQGCYACKEKGCCVVEDDMQELYREIEEADIVVFGTPCMAWPHSLRSCWIASSRFWDRRPISKAAFPRVKGRL